MDLRESPTATASANAMDASLRAICARVCLDLTNYFSAWESAPNRTADKTARLASVSAVRNAWNMVWPCSVFDTRNASELRRSHESFANSALMLEVD